jgi:hypothetical protein
MALPSFDSTHPPARCVPSGPHTTPYTTSLRNLKITFVCLPIRKRVCYLVWFMVSVRLYSVSFVRPLPLHTYPSTRCVVSRAHEERCISRTFCPLIYWTSFQSSLPQVLETLISLPRMSSRASFRLFLCAHPKTSFCFVSIVYLSVCLYVCALTVGFFSFQCVDMNLIPLDEDRDQRRSLVNSVMNLQVPYKTRIYLISWASEEKLCFSEWVR